jgi:hypothetical protein
MIAFEAIHNNVGLLTLIGRIKNLVKISVFGSTEIII